MSSTESNIHESLARKFDENGFKKTSLAQAVWEYIESVVGHTNLGPNITNALNETNKCFNEVIPPIEIHGGPVGQIHAANDSQFDVKKTGTHG
ncbi:hypothetical protein KBD33_04065 [Candidatus Gracilibacteria bacterium]|nr:hypothetical protein [Candidatus Gracilibacteria bacterium]